MVRKSYDQKQKKISKPTGKTTFDIYPTLGKHPTGSLPVFGA